MLCRITGLVVAKANDLQRTRTPSNLVNVPENLKISRQSISTPRQKCVLFLTQLVHILVLGGRTTAQIFRVHMSPEGLARVWELSSGPFDNIINCALGGGRH